MTDRPCEECIWRKGNECTNWDCEPVTRKEVREMIKELKRFKEEQGERS